MFMPTRAALEQAYMRGLNLIVAHESPFYQHRGDIVGFPTDPVCRDKRSWLEHTGLHLYRLHDHMHRRNPDYIVEGILRELGWEQHWCLDETPPAPTLHIPPLTIPTMRMRDVIELVKHALSIPAVRAVGDLNLPCSRIAVLPGYCGGGANAIPYLREANVDLVIAGEGPEWETPEYVRDAAAQGQPKGLIVLGHQQSEAIGMKYLASSLQLLFPEIPVEFIQNDPLFEVV